MSCTMGNKPCLEMFIYVGKSILVNIESQQAELGTFKMQMG